MRKQYLPHRIKQNHPNISLDEETVLANCWLDFRRNVISAEWIALPFEKQLEDCKKIFTLLKIYYRNWHVYLDRCNPSLNAEASAKRLVKGITKFAERAVKKAKAKRGHKPMKPTPKLSPSVILRKCTPGN